MESFEREIELLRIFHYALGLPVCLLADGRCVFSMPDEICAAAQAGSNAELSAYDPDEVCSAQYIRTEGGENYILMVLSGSIVITTGPFLVEKVPDSFLTELARSKKIRLRDKDIMQQYYDSLPMLSKQRYYYAGRLMEQLFVAGTRTNVPPVYSETTTAFIQPEYYRQAKDYRTQQFRHSPYMVEQEICRMIAGGDKQGAHRILKEINSRPRARLAGSAMRSLKNSVICSCSFMTRAAISGGVAPDEAFTLSDTYIQLVENSASMNSILGYEEDMVDGFTRAVNRAKNNRYSNAVTQALTYIDAHLCEPISVKDVADAVYLSPNYLSNLFLQETGETIHSCIIRRRIEEASFFVRNTSDPFAEIASFYQFSSQSHFVQTFKRIRGMTPGAYRRGTASPEPCQLSVLRPYETLTLHRKKSKIRAIPTERTSE